MDQAAAQTLCNYQAPGPQNHKSNTNEGKDPSNSRIPQMVTSFMFILEDIDDLVKYASVAVKL